MPTVDQSPASRRKSMRSPALGCRSPPAEQEQCVVCFSKRYCAHVRLHHSGNPVARHQCGPHPVCVPCTERIVDVLGAANGKPGQFACPVCRQYLGTRRRALREGAAVLQWARSPPSSAVRRTVVKKNQRMENPTQSALRRRDRHELRRLWQWTHQTEPKAYSPCCRLHLKTSPADVQTRPQQNDEAETSAEKYLCGFAATTARGERLLSPSNPGPNLCRRRLAIKSPCSAYDATAFCGQRAGTDEANTDSGPAEAAPAKASTDIMSPLNNRSAGGQPRHSRSGVRFSPLATPGAATTVEGITTGSTAVSRTPSGEGAEVRSMAEDWSAARSGSPGHSSRCHRDSVKRHSSRDDARVAECRTTGGDSEHGAAVVSAASSIALATHSRSHSARSGGGSAGESLQLPSGSVVQQSHPACFESGVAGQLPKSRSRGGYGMPPCSVSTGAECVAGAAMPSSSSPSSCYSFPAWDRWPALRTYEGPKTRRILAWLLERRLVRRSRRPGAKSPDSSMSKGGCGELRPFHCHRGTPAPSPREAQP